MATKEPALRDLSSDNLSKQKRACLYAYPVTEEDGHDIIAVFAVEFPALEGLEEELRQANRFLYNLAAKRL
jgi:hypothetical protein